MRSIRTLVAVVSLALVGGLAPGILGPAGAGNGPSSTFMVDPSSGPSPNTVTVSGEGCIFEQDSEGITLGGIGFPGQVVVELRNKADTATLHMDTFPAEEDGSWSEQFPIEAGLNPGLYPMKASCESPNGQVSAGVALAQALERFDYVDRSYTVVATSKKAKAVEAEVALTG